MGVRLKQLMDMVYAIGALPVLGGSYSNGSYKALHYEGLKDIESRLDNLGVLVIHLLAAVDDGNGKWKPHFKKDFAHPNAAGHRAMFGIVDVNKFSPEHLRDLRNRDAKLQAKSSAQPVRSLL